MKTFAVLVATISVVVSALSNDVDVKLEMVGNSEVKAVIANHGESDIRIFTPGSILDKSAVQKVKVAAGNRSVPFLGVRKRISTKKVDNSALQSIPAGQSVSVTFDIAKTYDLSAGGKFNIKSIGSLSYAQGDRDNKLVGTIPYHSNSIDVNVDGSKAAIARASFSQKWKRTRVQSDCTGEKLSITETALRNCAQLASAAEQAAQSGSDDKMEEYFKSSDSSTRDTVAEVFSRVAQECGSESSGVSTYYCSDVGNDCGGNVLAYTVPSESYMVYCDLYFNDLPDVTGQCHAQDQATTNIHECTHLSEIQGTDDLGYGYDAIRGLQSTDEELSNADTYALFANAIYANC